MIAIAQKVHCSECNEWKELSLNDLDAVKLIALQLCFDCEFWHKFFRMKDNPRAVRINGKHYWIGREDDAAPADWRGMGGGKVIIEFNDGRKVESTNLWFQGEIPERWLGRLPDNAQFIKQK